MIQQSLFPENSSKKSRGEENRENLERVRSRIEMAILEFFHMAERGCEFHAENLVDYIAAKGIACAPDSPGRIMRLLRKEKAIQYIVASRKESLYRVIK